MALPSSPPLFPEVSFDPPSSPLLLPASALDNSANSASAPFSRKRQLYETDNSSDPLFSDDTSGAEDVAGYERPKRKRMVRGPWYTLGRKSERSLREDMANREAFRNVDSGVWMGSDGTEDSLGNLPSSGVERLHVGHGAEEATSERAAPTPETMAHAIIETCVEDGNEVIDISDLGLTDVSSSMLRPLHQLIRQTHIDLTQPPSETEFVSLTPSIKLFLANNALSSLPSELCRLENITVLSLRSNELTELPPSVARLPRLKELNIAGNRLQYLPWELMDLLNCCNGPSTVSVRPNPLVEPTVIGGLSNLSKIDLANVAKEELGRCGDAESYYRLLSSLCSEEGILDKRVELELRLKLGRRLRNQHLQEAAQAGAEPSVCRDELIYLASSPVRYLEIDGGPCGKREESFDTAAVISQPTDLPHGGTSSNAAPSLFELATRAIQKHFSLDDIPPELPTRIRTALHRAASGLEYGNTRCSTCGRPFVIARGEWVEYWYNGWPSQSELTQETVLPFLRKACSWRCATPSEIGTFRC